MTLRLVTWNVNGIRNPLKYQPWRDRGSLGGMFDALEADIVVLQECKLQLQDLTDDQVLVPGWDCHFSLAKLRKGYSGVAIYTRQSKCCPIRAEEGLGAVAPATRDHQSSAIGGYLQTHQYSTVLPIEEQVMLDAEGRCVLLEFPAFVLLGIYSPAATSPQRLPSRQAYLEMLASRVRNLHDAGKEVVVVGDLNVVRDPVDAHGVAESFRGPDGFAIRAEWEASPSRRVFNQLVVGGRVAGERDPNHPRPVLHDLLRERYPDRTGMYTHWDVRMNYRPANIGTRIDYILCTPGIRRCVAVADTQPGLTGSDHCPVYVVLAAHVPAPGRPLPEATVPLVDVMNPEGMFRDGVRLREWSSKEHLLPLSGRLLPQFRRRDVRQMFKRMAGSAGPERLSKEVAEPETVDRATELESLGKPAKLETLDKPAESETLDDEAAEPEILNKSAKPETLNKKRAAEPAETLPNKFRRTATTTTTPRPMPKTSRNGKNKKAANKTADTTTQTTLTGFFKSRAAAATVVTASREDAATVAATATRPESRH